jgi:hypothetical protein
MQNSVSVEDYKEIVTDIKKLQEDLDKIGKRLPPSILAIYGEIIACIKLTETIGEKYYIKYRGGQAKSDIEIESKTNPKDKKLIDVKTSSFKEKEYYGTGFGWALDKKKCSIHNQKDFCYFDFLILVGIERSGKERFFVFSRDEVMNAPPSTSKRFKRHSNRIVMAFENVNYENVTSWDLDLIKNLDRYENRWDKIKS